MKLDSKEFKRFKELSAKAKSKKITKEEEVELAALTAKKNEKGSNDIAWWNAYPELLKNVANIPFNHVAGEAYRLFDGNAETDVYTPGLAVVKYLPTIGKSKKSSDAFNAQMRQLWLDMHRKYRGIGSYQASDLGIIMYAVVNVFTVIAKFERIYGVINTYQIANRNVPYTLVNALGISQDMMENLASFRYGLNLRIAKLQQLCLPKGIQAIDNELILNLFIYKDSDNPRASLFCFDPEYFYNYYATAMSTGGSLQANKFEDYMNGTTPGGKLAFNVTDVFTVLDLMMDNLFSDDDVAKVCSDLIAAYGPENVMTVGFVPEDLALQPVHDYERSLQFHNLTFFTEGVKTTFDKSGLTANDETFIKTQSYGICIYQKNDVIYNELTTWNRGSGNWYSSGNLVMFASNSDHDSADANPIANRCLLDTWVDNPGDVEIVCGTRFTSICSKEKVVSSGGNNYYYYDVDTFGLEVVTSIILWKKTGVSCNDTPIVGQVITDNSSMQATDMELHQFDWSPILYHRVVGSSDVYILSDIDNATVLTADQLAPIHDVAIYSAFKIPTVSYINQVVQFRKL